MKIKIIASETEIYLSATVLLCSPNNRTKIAFKISTN